MIDLRKRRPPEPAEFQSSNPVVASEAVSPAQRALENAKSRIRVIIDDDELPVSGDFRPLWSRYKHLLAEAQHGGKCAYCETRILPGYPGDVEHYRPKAEVKEPRDRGNRDDTGGKAPGRRWGRPTKPGYWWLAYRWDNYLYSCNRCNNWKANSFPLRGSRGSMAPGIEAEEDPLILNPYVTEPVPHMSFNELGEIVGLTEAGTVTIDRCGLDRRNLVIDRERIALQLLRDLEDYVEALAAENPMAKRHALRRLLDACDDSKPYAGMARVIVAEKAGLDYEELAMAWQLGLLS